MKSHNYEIRVDWTGNDGQGTSTYRSYRRDHTLTAPGKPPLLASSDPAFRGDGTRYNPEDLLVGSLSACHMLWYLHLCSANQIVVVEYQDNATGEMKEDDKGSARFVQVLLRPKVTIAAGGDREKARELHQEAHRLCFIAKSVNFPVEAEPEIVEASPA